MPAPATGAPAHTPAGILYNERGLTLTELTIVGLLATLVMVGLTTFYLNSHQVWLDGSTQALAQRDATMLVDQLSRRVHEADSLDVAYSDPDGLHDRLTLYYADHHTVDFVCIPDSGGVRLHLLLGTFDGGATDDQGPVVDTPVTRFHLQPRGTTVVDLTLAQLSTANGDTVSISSSFALLGK